MRISLFLEEYNSLCQKYQLFFLSLDTNQVWNVLMLQFWHLIFRYHKIPIWMHYPLHINVIVKIKASA
jgi:hypothetical protein